MFVKRVYVKQVMVTKSFRVNKAVLV